MFESKKIKNYRGELLAALSGILFITIAATWESPIYKGSYGYDASFFSMMGRAILAGKVPYRDYFDIKGPVFFFIEAFGQLLHKDRLGVYFIECIAASFAFVFLYKICKLYKFSAKKTLAVFFVTIYIYITTLWGGNTAEEFLLPFNYACIYHGLKFVKRKSDDIGIAFFFGMTFAIGVLSKVTIIAPMAAMTICIVGYLINKKRYKDLFTAGILFVAGLVVVAAPVCLYFVLRNAFGDFINAAFITAFKRSTDYYESFSIKWESYLVICYVGIILFAARIKYKGIEKWLLLSLSVILFGALHLGTPFDYYFTSLLPLYSFVTILICRDASLLYVVNKRKMRYVLNCMILSIIGLVAALMFYNAKTLNKLHECYDIAVNDREVEAYNEFKEIFNLIPESEYDDVFCIESGMIVYEVNQVLPSSKYPVNFPYFTQLYPPSKNEVIYKLYNYPPKWIISEGIENFELTEIRDYVMGNYIKITENSKDQLWLRTY